jgi:hypothetical protein
MAIETSKKNKEKLQAGEILCFTCDKIIKIIKCPDCGCDLHLYCSKCGKVLPLPISEEHIAGLCGSCQQNEDDEKEAEFEETHWEDGAGIMPDPAEQAEQELEEKEEAEQDRED